MRIRNMLPTFPVLALVLASPAVLRSVADGLIFHDIKTLAPTVRKSATFWPVVTNTGSLFTGEMSEVFNQAPHHHEQEQVTFGLSGAFDVTIGGVVYQLPAYHAVIIPSNVPHFMTNKSGARAGLLEYQPVARRDWLQVSAPIPAPSAPAAALPEGRVVAADLSPASSGWTVERNGARVKTFAGQTIRIRMLDLSARDAAVSVTGAQAPVQRFIYVFAGRARIESGSTTREIHRELNVEIPSSAPPVTVSAIGVSPTVLAVFEPLVR